MTKWERTLDKLEYEIDRLKGSDIRIEAGFTSSQIGNSGWYRAGAKPAHPGVVLYFDTPADGSLCFPCGTYAQLAANLHAIALTLENLRAIDRYGVTLQHEQYRGFLALPPAPDALTVEGAAKIIARAVGAERSDLPESIVARVDIYREAYRQAATRAHPDVPGGSQDLFLELGRAKATLDLHHGLNKPAEAAR